MKKLDLTKYEFPKLKNVDVAFSTLRTDKKLFDEAKRRGFYNANTKYNKLFSQLFNNGGKVNFKTGIDESFKTSAFAYLKAFMGSFEPSHEEKEAVCAMILSEIVECKC